MVGEGPAGASPRFVKGACVMESLSYGEGDRYFPIPENERNLQTVRAEHFADVPMDDVRPGLNILEGLCFTRDGGTLYLCNTPMGRIYTVDMASREVRLLVQLPDHMCPSAIKIHRDGRLFVTMAASDGGGLVAVLSPAGEILDRIVTGTGRAIDDMVFDRQGGFYFTDLDGGLDNKRAGVFYVEPDYETVRPVIPGGMIESNGIALDPDWKHLWITEYGAGRLHRFEVSEETHQVVPFTSYTPYYFCGLEGPDSCVVDADGNLYVSMCGQGRFLVFNRNAFPIGNILLPGREHGHMCKSTHIAIRPGTHEAYMCSADLATGESAIFRAGAYAGAHRTFQFL